MFWLKINYKIMSKYNKIIKNIFSCLILSVLFIVIHNKLLAQEDPDEMEYDVCPGWGFKCISITKDTFLGAITVPVRFKGKNRSAIEPIQKE